MNKETLTATATCGNRAPASEYICERPLGHAGDHSAVSKSDDFPMTVEWSETNETKPKSETAFQGMVRKYLPDLLDDREWGYIVEHYSIAIARVLTIFNATLDLAKGAVGNWRMHETSMDIQQTLEALKEPTP